MKHKEDGMCSEDLTAAELADLLVGDDDDSRYEEIIETARELLGGNPDDDELADFIEGMETCGTPDVISELFG